jgi:hypothetical protein
MMFFKYAIAHSQSCESYQNYAGRDYKDIVPLYHVVVEELFEQWGLDIISDTNPHSSKRNMYILIATNYFTCWTEAIPLTKVNDETIMNFLEKMLSPGLGCLTLLCLIMQHAFHHKKNWIFLWKMGLL